MRQLDTAFVALAGALGLGGLAAWWLWTWRWGLNLCLLALVLVGLVALLHRRNGEAWRQDRWMLVPAVFFALTFAWHEARGLFLLDGLALLVAVSLPLWRPLGAGWRQLTPETGVRGAAAGAAACAFGAPILVGRMRWREVRDRGAWGMLRRVGVGLAIAAPMVLVFGALFMSADAGFEGLVTGLVQVDLESLVGRLMLASAVAWAAAGLLGGVTGPRPTSTPHWPWRLGLVETLTVLAVVDALFATFVAMQLPYLFGGATLVESARALTYAEYARRGFFELAMVSALALGLLLALEGISRPAPGRPRRLFAGLAGLLVLLLVVIIASAAQRMLLYQGIYGLTELRIDVLAFELWLLGVLAWFCATVLAGRRERFTWGLLVWAFLGLAAMNAPNWQELIVRHNVALGPERTDAAYLAHLSADAAPALVASLDALTPDDRRRVAGALLRLELRLAQDDWRGWTWSSHRAKAALQAAKPKLQAAAK